jgi:hypothetical protein
MRDNLIRRRLPQLTRAKARSRMFGIGSVPEAFLADIISFDANEHPNRSATLEKLNKLRI